MRHETALWGAVGAFFASILAIGAIDLLNPGERAQFLGALFVAFITAGAVYSKQRLDDAKKYIGDLVVKRDSQGKLIYSLELNDDPELDLETRKEITFKVKKGSP